MTPRTALLPCAFCGGPAEHDGGCYSGKPDRGGRLPVGHAIYCADSDCIGSPPTPHIWQDDEGGYEAAASAWNTRVFSIRATLHPANTEGCDWPEKGRFTFYDEPGEHDPCYVVMPGGAMLPLNHHAGAGVDIARAMFIVEACNAALADRLTVTCDSDAS